VNAAADAPRRTWGLTDEARRVWNLTWTLASTDWKLRFYGSALGVAWTLVRPFAFFAVVYVVFAEIAKVGEDIHNYPAYILMGLTLFGLFSDITASSVSALVTRESLLRKMRFPRIVIPLSVAVTGLLNLGMTLVAVFIFLIALGLVPTLAWLELIPIIGLIFMFALGCGLLLSALFVRYRDVQPIWEVAVQMLFYASPILYVATMVPEEFLRPYMANPLAALLTEMRHAVIDPNAAGAAEAIGGAERLLIPLGIIVGTFVLGYVVFRRMAPRVAENL
jgi:ABC-2 type transport system permease protein